MLCCHVTLTFDKRAFAGTLIWQFLLLIFKSLTLACLASGRSQDRGFRESRDRRRSRDRSRDRKDKYVAMLLKILKLHFFLSWTCKALRPLRATVFSVIPPNTLHSQPTRDLSCKQETLVADSEHPEILHLHIFDSRTVTVSCVKVPILFTLFSDSFFGSCSSSVLLVVEDNRERFSWVQAPVF